MKKLNNLIIALVAIGMLTVSCKKDHEAGVIAPSDGKSNPDIQAFQKSMKDDVTTLVNSEGVKGVTSFMSTFSNFNIARSTAYSKKLAIFNNKIDSKVLSKYPMYRRNLEIKNKALVLCANIIDLLGKNSRQSETDQVSPFDIDLNDVQGVYQYDVEKGEYVKTSTNYDGVLLKFPADCENNPTTYNGQLVISKFEVQEVTFNGEQVKLPSNLNIELTIDGKKLAGVAFDVVYCNEMIPVRSLNLNVFVQPLDLNLKFNNSTSLMALSCDLTNTETATQMMSADVKVGVAEEALTAASGFVQVYSLKTVFDITVPKGEDGLDGINEANFDDYIKVELYNYPNNNYVGKLKVKEEKLIISTYSGDLDVNEFISNMFSVEQES